MISIDAVYQKVLAIANKEQRGYITPQEFNLFANMAQNEIFTQYFYDAGKFDRLPADNDEYGDLDILLSEKQSLFKGQAIFNNINTHGNYVKSKHWLHIGSVLLEVADDKRVRADRLDITEWDVLTKGSKITPNNNHPVYTERYVASDLVISLKPVGGEKVIVNYIRKPLRPNWSYVVINNKPLLNLSADDYQNFELHSAEESRLVNKILIYAGIAINKPEISQAARGIQGAEEQNRKS
jgi:hypothetical protein